MRRPAADEASAQLAGLAVFAGAAAAALLVGGALLGLLVSGLLLEFFASDPIFAFSAVLGAAFLGCSTSSSCSATRRWRRGWRWRRWRC